MEVSAKTKENIDLIFETLGFPFFLPSFPARRLPRTRTPVPSPTTTPVVAPAPAETKKGCCNCLVCCSNTPLHRLVHHIDRFAQLLHRLLAQLPRQRVADDGVHDVQLVLRLVLLHPREDIRWLLQLAAGEVVQNVLEVLHALERLDHADVRSEVVQRVRVQRHLLAAFLRALLDRCVADDELFEDDAHDNGPEATHTRGGEPIFLQSNVEAFLHPQKLRLIINRR